MTEVEFQAKQFTISDEGELMYQANPTNPLPGVAIAQLTKGAHVLQPQLTPLTHETGLTEEQVQNGLSMALNEALSVFMALTTFEAEVAAPVQEICQKLYDAAGMLPREEAADALKQLDPDMRAALRGKGVRLGPLFLYCPEMNKPASLRVRAVLWGLFHDMDLPVQRIPDGMVSKKVESDSEPLDQAQKSLYKALCYPVYGGRAIRVDMLDRVVNAIYDSADKGKFKAQHAMAEWMGCPIVGLYNILEALGHKKLSDPAEEAAKAAAEAAPEAVEPEASAEAAPEAAATAPEAEQASSEEKAAPASDKAPQEKPELATFGLKRGKANEQGQGGKARSGGRKFEVADKGGKPSSKPYKGKKKHSDKGQKKDRGPRVISAEAKTEADSPFAILGQLKK